LVYAAFRVFGFPSEIDFAPFLLGFFFSFLWNSQEFRLLGWELSIIESRALVERVREFVDQLHEELGGLRKPGQVRYVAVAEGQPAGRPLVQCVTIPVLLTVLGSTDAELLVGKGSVALRGARISRMADEARRQGGLLSYEDLSVLVGVDVSTVRRAVDRCRRKGVEVPTRGRVSDIGPGVSHRARVIELLFRGMQPAQIAVYTSHALSSVERYIADFARVMELTGRNYPRPAIQRITGLSPKVVRDYLELLKEYSDEKHRHVIDMLLQRFYPVNPQEEE
jgi:hypothetical protein